MDIDKIIAELAGRGLLMIADTHMQHFAENSYARHMALGEYYEELEELIDTAIEASIGNGWKPEELLNKPFEFTFNSPDAVIENIQEFNEFLGDMIEELDESEDNPNNAGIASWAFLSNICQDIETLNNQTLYKLIRLS